MMLKIVAYYTVWELYGSGQIIVVYTYNKIELVSVKMENNCKMNKMMYNDKQKRLCLRQKRGTH